MMESYSQSEEVNGGLHVFHLDSLMIQESKKCGTQTIDLIGHTSQSLGS